MVGNARNWPPGWWRSAYVSDLFAQTALLRAQAREKRAEGTPGSPDDDRGWGEPPPASVLERLPVAAA